MKRNFPLIVWPLVFWLCFLGSAAWGNSYLLVANDTPSGNTRYRGHLSIDAKDSSFTQCDTGDSFEIIDRTDGELLPVYKELAYQPGAKVYVEVLGGKKTGSKENLAQLTILKMLHAAVETKGCGEDLSGFSFRASGNEPFWNIVVTNKNISFWEMGQPEIVFPSSTLNVSDNHQHYVTETTGPSPQKLTIVFQKKPCRDTMSGTYFNLAVHVRLDNRDYSGCARQGLEQYTFMPVEDLKNAEYFSDWSSTGKVRLKNSIYRETIVPGSATKLTIRLGNFIAFGDLNHDGVNEAVAILISDGGGSGTFHDLVVLNSCNGSPEHIATAQLGDRVRVQSLTIQFGHILLEMITHGPTDPMASPSLLVRKQYRLQGDQLVQIDNN